MPRRRAVVAAFATALAGCEGVTVGGDPRTDADVALSSPAFDHEGAIPTRFTCDGAGVSPPLAVDETLEPTEALALVAEYPDSVGQTLTHWLLWNVPPDVTTIPADQPTTPELPSLGGARQGKNDAGRIGYAPLCPPPSPDPAPFWFTLHALDRTLDLPAGAGRDAFDDAVGDASLASARLVGRYRRRTDA